MTKTIPEQQRNQIIRIFTAENEKKMTVCNDTALVLEGGGLRGVFTCGVLDCFMDKGIPQE